MTHILGGFHHFNAGALSMQHPPDRGCTKQRGGPPQRWSGRGDACDKDEKVPPRTTSGEINPGGGSGHPGLPLASALPEGREEAIT